MYDGKIDLNDHIITFEDHMDIFNLNDDEKYKIFIVTLTKPTKRWYH